MIETAVRALINKERFYGLFFLQVRRHYGKQVATAGVNITNQINLYVNPDFWATLTIDQQCDVLKHEAMHIFHNHLDRAKDYQQKKIWNLACDIAINEPLKSLHDMGITYARIKEMIPTALPNMPAEYYYTLMINDERFQDAGTVDDHGEWENGGNGDMQKEILKEALKKTANDMGGVGNCPSEIQRLLEQLCKSNVNWKQQLRQFFQQAERSLKTTTRKKRNRRYGIMFPGQKSHPKLSIAILNDESGSVGDLEFAQFYSEIDYIKNLYKDRLNIQVIHCDTQVNSCFEYKKGQKIERTGTGGTELNPGIEKAMTMDVDGLIVFTDGGIYEEITKKPRCNTLWAIVGSCDFTPPYGRKINIEVSGEE